MFNIGDEVVFSPKGVEHFVHECGWEYGDPIFDRVYVIIESIPEGDGRRVNGLYDWVVEESVEIYDGNHFWMGNDMIVLTTPLTGQMPLPFKGGFR